MLSVVEFHFLSSTLNIRLNDSHLKCTLPHTECEDWMIHGTQFMYFGCKMAADTDTCRTVS